MSLANTGLSALSTVVSGGGISSPADLPGVKMFWKRDGQLTDVAGEASDWGEAGYSATWQSVANRPDILSTPDRVHWDIAASERMNSNVAVEISTFSIVLVQYQNSVSKMVMEQSPVASSNPGFFFYTGSGHLWVRKGSTNMHLDVTAGLPIGTALRVWTYHYDGTADGSYIGLDGIPQAMTKVVDADPGDAVVSDTIYYGSRNNASLFMDSHQTAGIICSPHLSAENLAFLDDPAAGWMNTYKESPYV